MSDMITAEAAGKLLDDWENPETGYGRDERDAVAPDLARTVIALHAQLADAKAAQAMVVERAATEIKLRRHLLENVQNVVIPREEELAVYDICEAAIRALADTDGLALVQALRAERDRFEAALGRACLVGGTTYLVERAETAIADRDRLAAANAALEAQVEALRGAVTAYHLALDRRENGNTAGYRLQDDVQRILEMPWRQGAALASAQGGAQTPEPFDGTIWLNTTTGEVTVKSRADARREGGE